MYCYINTFNNNENQMHLTGNLMVSFIQVRPVTSKAVQRKCTGGVELLTAVALFRLNFGSFHHYCSFWLYTALSEEL